MSPCLSAVNMEITTVCFLLTAWNMEFLWNFFPVLSEVYFNIDVDVFLSCYSAQDQLRFLLHLIHNFLRCIQIPFCFQLC